MSTPEAPEAPETPETPETPEDREAPDRVVDARGMRCPLPVIELARQVTEWAAAGRVIVLATDPAAAHDIPAWCRMRGHRFVEERPAGDHTVYVVDVLES
ncbi:sulfurtransferase TusA family protein [Intrasporangium sp. DVR]|uniref:sulfurtransferase TusA family protein n=1 Tax=Intrasporangium sp. DVR TaxID=3127867 RepID=UPI00313A5F24